MLLHQAFVLLIAAKLIKAQTTDCAESERFGSCLNAKITSGCDGDEIFCLCSLYSAEWSCYKSACPAETFLSSSYDSECLTAANAAPSEASRLAPSHASATITGGTVSSAESRPSKSSSGSVLATGSSPSKSSSDSVLATGSSPSKSSSGSVSATESSPSKSSSGSVLATTSRTSAGAPVLVIPLGMFLAIASVVGVAFF